MDDWSIIIPAASENYIPCDENTIESSEVRILYTYFTISYTMKKY